MSEPRRPDNIPGYVHPETSSSVPLGTSSYKTFTEGQKPKKKEKFGTIQGGTHYSKAVFSEELCPDCNGPAIFTCNCAYNDKKCENGHIWYTDRSGKLKAGNPHK